MLSAGKTRKLTPRQRRQLAAERAKVRRFGEHVRKERAYIDDVKRKQGAAKVRNEQDLERLGENAKVLEGNRKKIKEEGAKSRANLRKQGERVAGDEAKYRRDAAKARTDSDGNIAGAKVAIRLAMRAHEYAIRMWWDNAKRSLTERESNIRKFNDRIFGRQLAMAHAEDYELMAFSFGIRPEQLYPGFEEPSVYPDGRDIRQREKNHGKLLDHRRDLEARLAKVRASLDKNRAGIVANERKVNQWEKEQLAKQLKQYKKLKEAERQLVAQRDSFPETDERIEKGEADVRKKEQQYRKAARAVGLG
jgi:hypothetical protein